VKKNTILFLIVCICFANSIQSQAIDIGDIPPSRIAASGWEDIQFDESGTWTTVDVTNKGVVPDTGADMGPAIQSMINSGSGKTIYKFPAGIYNINSTVTITKGDFQIIGDGSATKFHLLGGPTPPMIIIQGAKDSGTKTLQTDINRGDDKITVTSVSGLAVGDFINIKQANGERTGDTDDQIVKIVAINGNVLTIDMKMGLPFTVAKASVEKYNFIKNVKLSEFYIERVTLPDIKDGQLRLSYIFNGLISHVESNKTLAQHIEINDSRNVLLFQNNIYGNYGHNTEGGYQGGIVINRSTRINVINNRLDNLRHHIALQFGSNHCVIAYNRTTIYNHYGDYGQHNSKGCHNNLFEGNFGEELCDDNDIKGWGSPYVMWFRNHAILKIGSYYTNQMNMSIIGNELRTGIKGIIVIDPAKDNFIAANIVSIDKENGTGQMTEGNLPTNSKIPNSLFLKSKPDYLSRWPLYGPSGILGIDDFKTDKKSISIYPNPNKGVFTISRSSSTPGMYEVFDINGQLVTQGQLNESSQQLQLKEVASGVYFLKVTAEGASEIAKIIIQK